MKYIKNFEIMLMKNQVHHNNSCLWWPNFLFCWRCIVNLEALKSKKRVMLKNTVEEIQRTLESQGKANSWGMESDNKPGQKWEETVKVWRRTREQWHGSNVARICRNKDWSIIHLCWKILTEHALVSGPALSAGDTTADKTDHNPESQTVYTF